MISLSVIIPTHLRPKPLRSLLQSLAKQRYRVVNSTFEVIVVGNIPDKRTRSVIEEFKDCALQLDYRISGSCGVNRARNLGVRYAKGETLLFLDDDCRLVDPHYLEKVYLSHKQHPDASVIGGRYLLKENASWVETSYHINADNWLSYSKVEELKTTQLIGGNISFKAHVLAHRFRFNENIIFGGAEAELNARLVQENHTMILDESIPVVHDLKISCLNLFKKGFKQGVGRRLQVSPPKDTLKKSAYPKIEPSDLHLSFLGKIFVLLYLSLFNFFYRSGYRHAELPENKRYKVWSIFASIYAEFTRKESAFSLTDTGLKNSSAHAPYHLLSRPNLEWFAIFHWLKSRVWVLPWKLMAPIHIAKENIWKIFKIPYHYIKSRLWILFQVPYHTAKNHAWKLIWLSSRPYHYIKKNIWILVIVPYHRLKLTVAIARRLALAPIHFIKQNLWRLVVTPYYFCARYFRQGVLLLEYPYHLLKQHLWKAINIPYHMVKANAWKLRRVPVQITVTAYHFLKMNFWRIHWQILQPYHILRSHLWRVPFTANAVWSYTVQYVFLRVFHFIKKNLWRVSHGITIITLLPSKLHRQLLSCVWRVPVFFNHQLPYLKIWRPFHKLYYFIKFQWLKLWVFFKTRPSSKNS